MGYNTKIDWCDTTWNPVTGCYHGCEYCYARGIANRFGGYSRKQDGTHTNFISDDGTYELNEPLIKIGKDGVHRQAPYPLKFKPTLHRYRLDQPKKWSEPRTIFVCSMADLFGDWVPISWIQEVFKACEAAPQHRYLFLTKNPQRYHSLAFNGELPQGDNYWYGSTAETDEQLVWFANSYNTFTSIEPIQQRFDCSDVPKDLTNWIIVGAETGNRAGKVVPQREWIDELVDYGKRANIPVFMKDSLRELMGEDFKQEFPWEVKRQQ